jgi:hypothetical protein
VAAARVGACPAHRPGSCLRVALQPALRGAAVRSHAYTHDAARCRRSRCAVSHATPRHSRCSATGSRAQSLWTLSHRSPFAVLRWRQTLQRCARSVVQQWCSVRAARCRLLLVHAPRCARCLRADTAHTENPRCCSVHHAAKR